MIVFFFILLGYLVGSVPSGYIIARAKGINIREHGSGNIGATNMNRVLGQGMGALTLIGDILKGCLMLVIAKNFISDTTLLALIAYAILLGNCFSIFLRGRGGKGVATTFGIYLALAPKLFLVGGILYGLMKKMTGKSGVGSLFAALLWPILGYFWLETPYFYLSIAISCLIIMRHHANISDMYQNYCKKIKK